MYSVQKECTSVLICFVIKALSAVILVIFLSVFTFSEWVEFLLIKHLVKSVYTKIALHVAMVFQPYEVYVGAMTYILPIPLFPYPYAHSHILLFLFPSIQNCPHKAAREPSMIIPSGDTCQLTGVPQVLHLPPISVAGIN